MSKHKKKIRYNIHYVKPTAQLLLKIPAIIEARLKYLNAMSCGCQKDWAIKQTVEHTRTTRNGIAGIAECPIAVFMHRYIYVC